MWDCMDCTKKFSTCTHMGGHVPLRTVLPFLNKHYHLLTFPSFIVPSSHTNNLPVNFVERKFLSFKSHITNHTSQAVGDSIFMFSCKDYSECGLGAIHVPLDLQKMTDLYRKCTCHLHGHNMLTVLSF